MSEENVLFQITEDKLDTGLRGFPVGHCVTSTVHPEKGLFYGDLSIPQVTSWQPERVIFLLMKGRDGSQEEIASFSADFKKRSQLSKETIEAISKFPKKGDPMRLFIMAILTAGLFESKNDYREDGLRLIATIPEIVAHVINHHGGWGQTPPSNPSLGYMENFTQMLKVPGKPSSHLPEVFRLFDILHFDHGGGNLSTFVGKAVASGLEDMYGSIASAMSALSGPRHGRANQECYHFVQEVLEEVGETGDVEAYIRQRLAKGGLIYGFGHAVLRVEDPRATVQYAFAKKHFGDNALIKMALAIREAGIKVLKENPKISDPYPNVDAVSGAMLSAAGFPYPEYFPVLFGLSRTVGIAIQIIYERLEARGGKGTPIVRPKYIYSPRNK